MKRILHVVVIGFLTVFSSTAHAQTEYPPLPVQLESIYPAAIRITTTVPVAVQDIAAARLTVTLPGYDPEIIDLDLRADVVQPTPTPQPEVTPEATPQPFPPSTTLAALYRLNPDALPRLFRDRILYEWTVTLDNGDVLTGQLEREFRDDRFGWRLVNDTQDRLDIRLADAYRDFDSIPPRLIALYDALARTTGDSPSLDWALYLGFEIPVCFENEQGVEVARGVVTPIDVECPPNIGERLQLVSELQAFNPRTDIPLLDALSDRLFETFYAPYWEGADIPAWFTDALRRYFHPDDDYRLLASAITAVRTNRTLSLDVIDAPTVDRDLRAVQAYGLLAYLIDTAGAEAVYRLAREVGDYDNFATAYGDIIGEPLTRLVENWERWIFTANAGVAYSVSPFQLPTPTLFPTDPVTPSHTFTPTPTATATPTITPTLPTPIPTRTSSPTVTPPSSTVTPRLPGSLDTSVPSSAQSVSSSPFELGSSTGVIILGTLVIGIIALAAVYIALGRRR